MHKNAQHNMHVDRNKKDKFGTLNDETVQALEFLTHVMDNAFTIPGTQIRVGLDSLIGLFPVIGDTLGVAVSGYIYSYAKKAGVPWYMRLKMIWNIFIDWLIGLVPFLGDIFDVGWKANTKNLKIILAHHKKNKDADIIEGTYTKTS